nr:MAG TPA: hypothetical protein [Bacteriophage sp.]
MNTRLRKRQLCEHNHKLRLRVLEIIHTPINEAVDGYPQRVILTGEDGKHVWYTRDK